MRRSGSTGLITRLTGSFEARSNRSYSKMASLNHSQQAFEDLKRKRARAAEELRSLADDVQTHHRKVNIAKLFGTCVSLIGTVLIVGGTVASAFTFGGAAPVIAAGGGFAAAAGTITALGAELAESLLTNERMEKAQKAFNDDYKATAAIMKLLAACLNDNTSQKKEAVAAQLGKAANSVYEIVEAFNTAKKAAQVFSAGAEVTETTVKTFLKSLGKAGRISLGLSLVAVPHDVFTLVKTSIDFHKGSLPDIASSLRAIADTMEKDVLMMEQAFRNQQLTG